MASFRLLNGNLQEFVEPAVSFQDLPIGGTAAYDLLNPTFLVKYSATHAYVFDRRTKYLAPPSYFPFPGMKDLYSWPLPIAP